MVQGEGEGVRGRHDEGALYFHRNRKARNLVIMYIFGKRPVIWIVA